MVEEMMITGQKALNCVYGFFGWKGSGKTTALTLMLYAEHLAHPEKPVYTNYRVSFMTGFLHGDDMFNNEGKLDNAIVGVDEIHEYCDSRNSNSLQNRRVSSFFLQSRHTRSNILFSSQFRDQIEKRVRRICDCDIVCENLFIDYDKDGDDDIFKMTLLDRRRPEMLSREKIFYAKPIFSMFNSTERIDPFVVSQKTTDRWWKKHGGDEE